MKQIIVLGNDHLNTVGVIQGIGRKGYYPIAVIWGRKTGFVKSSIYTKEIHGCPTQQDCINYIIEKYKNSDTRVIIPCCDDAAIVLEQNKTELEKYSFLFQHTCSNHSILDLENKNYQVQLAEKHGFSIPKSWKIESIKDVPSDMQYPCLIKPMLTVEGATKDIRVCRSKDELFNILEDVFTRTKRVLLQQFIEKDYDFLVYGCGYNRGECFIPDLIQKLGLYPVNTGLGTVISVNKLDNPDIANPIRSFIKEIGYVGLFSVEFARSVHDGKYYLIEFNFRNDALNSSLEKAGICFPEYHIKDQLGESVTDIENHELKPIKVIFERNHLMSMLTGQTSFFRWVKELFTVDSFKIYYKEDPKPFVRQFTNMVVNRLPGMMKRKY